jgi:hypothetical protein
MRLGFAVGCAEDDLFFVLLVERSRDDLAIFQRDGDEAVAGGDLRDGIEQGFEEVGTVLLLPMLFKLGPTWLPSLASMVWQAMQLAPR